MKNNNLIWLSTNIKNETGEIYYVKIININNYKILTEIWLNKKEFEIFKNIMKSNIYSLQYLQHPNLNKASIIKLKKSPHKEIKSLKNIEINDKEFYLEN